MAKVPSSLFEAALLYWRYFLPMWVFPIFFLLGGTTADNIEKGEAFFRLIITPLFFICFITASIPGIRKKTTSGQSAILVMFIPFTIWVFIVYLRLAIIKMLGL